MSENKTQHKFLMTDLPCQQVVVFTDRAEVKRSLKAKLIKGENEIAISRVSDQIDTDSVRVEGVGKATVIDVICERKYVTTENVASSEKTGELLEHIKSLEIKDEKLKQKQQRLRKQQSALDDFAKSLSSVNSSKGDNSVEPASSKQSVDNFLSFLDTYETKIEGLDEKIFATNKEIEKNTELLNAARNNYNSQNGVTTTSIIEITTLIEAAEDTDIELHLSYVVFNASWSPKYDIRVYSDNKSMVINYFGMIQQATGEDWNDTKISLSTAVPSIGGNIPELGTQNVRIKQHIKHFYAAPKSARKMKKSSLSMCSSSRGYALEEECDTQEEFSAMRSVCRISQIKTEVKDGIISSTYDIPRKVTVPADNKSHKVSIGIVELKPEFEYECVPKISPHAFLKTKVKNNSVYALLAGPANVFFDNNFVAKTQLKSYSPQEELSCSLGVDPSIKVTYKPVKKFKEQTGLISKTTITTHEQVIEIKNTTKNEIKILVKEQLPLSNDDKIQIKLIEPVIKGSTVAKINASNNIEFEMKIAGNKQEDLKVKYSIDHPASEEIEFC